MDMEVSDKAIAVSADKDFLARAITRLHAYRININESAEHVAGAVGISAKYLRELENGKKEANFPVIYKLAEYYQISLISLIMDIEPLPEDMEGLQNEAMILIRNDLSSEARAHLDGIYIREAIYLWKKEHPDVDPETREELQVLMKLLENSV